MVDSDNKCSVSTRRLSDAEKHLEDQHKKLHGVCNELTGVKLKAELLGQDFDHHRTDIVRSTEALRDSVRDLRGLMQDVVDESNKARLSRQALHHKVNSHSAQLLWLTRTATAVGLLGVGAALTRFFIH